VGNLELKRVVRKTGKEKGIDLDAEYRDILKNSEITILYESMKELEPKVNTLLIQTINRLISHANGQVPPLSYDNVEPYLLDIMEKVDSGDINKRTYKANLKKLFTLVNFSEDITLLVSRRKGRVTKKINMPLSQPQRHVGSYKKEGKSLGLSAEQARLPSQDCVTKLEPLKITLKNSNNRLIEINLREIFSSPFIGDIDLDNYAKRIHDSSLRDASKFTYLSALKQLVAYNNIVTNSPEFFCKSVVHSFISNLLDQVEKGELKVKIESIEKKQAILSAAFELIGLPKLKKADRIRLKTGGNELQTDNYDDIAWNATVRAIIPEHQRLYKAVLGETINYNEDFNNFIACSCLLLTLYTGMTFSEIITLMHEEFDTSYTSLGAKDYVYSAIKYRSDASHTYDSFIARRSSKTLVVRLMEVVALAKRKLDIDTQNIIFLINHNQPVQPDSLFILNFSNSLIKRNQILQDLLIKRPKYKLNLQRLRSSVIQRVSSKKGEASGVIAGKHRLSVHRSYNYSKVSSEVAQKAMTKAAHALEEHARGATIHIAVDRGQNLYNPKIIEEEDKLKSGLSELKNGGMCSGEETAESREFQKRLDRNPLLSQEDKKQMGCGFIIKCFGCASFAVVDEVNDIWKLL
jgi:chloramphenicol 3-O-phosphotransferase